MTAYKYGRDQVLLGRSMGGNEGENIRWDAIDGGEQIPPFANSRQRDRDVLVELGNRIKGESVLNG